jgi:hypothetical protein
MLDLFARLGSVSSMVLTLKWKENNKHASTMTTHRSKFEVNPTPEMWVGLKVEEVCTSGMLVRNLPDCNTVS